MYIDKKYTELYKKSIKISNIRIGKNRKKSHIRKIKCIPKRKQNCKLNLNKLIFILYI